MNANIRNTQIFQRIKYDLKGHERSHKAKIFQADSFYQSILILKKLWNSNIIKRKFLGHLKSLLHYGEIAQF